MTVRDDAPGDPGGPTAADLPAHLDWGLAMTSPLVLGLDIGTTTCKAAVFDTARPTTPVAVARRASVTGQPRPGWSEADPDAVLAAVLECVSEVVPQVDGRSICAIGISGTACGAWLIDAGGRPVRPAILWNDGRAASVVAGWQADGTINEIFARTGNVPFPGYTLPELVWLAAHEPEALDRATTVLFCKDWVRLGLTGVRATDASEASYVPFDIRGRVWDAELFERCGMGAQLHLLPEIAPDDASFPLLPSVAAELGLPPGIPVAMGATDIVAAVLGSGAAQPGQAVTILGTSANSTVVSAEPDFEPFGVGIMAAMPLGTYARTMINTSGSTTLDWVAALIADGDIARFLSMAEACPPDADRPILVPYLANAGVVSPHPDPTARGTFAGLRVDHGAPHIARATVEGLAVAVADCYACMTTPVTDVRAVGGAARSSLLLQAIADASGARVHRLAGEESGARGVALLAAWAAGVWTAEELVTNLAAVEVSHTFEPEPERMQVVMDRYRAVRDDTSERWRQW